MNPVLHRRYPTITVLFFRLPRVQEGLKNFDDMVGKSVVKNGRKYTLSLVEETLRFITKTVPLPQLVCVDLA